MEKSKSGVLWIRESTEEQGRGYNPVDQLKKCRAYAEREGVSVLREFKIEETGFNEKKRKNFNEMVEFLKENDVNYLVTYTIDRLGRNMPDSIKVRDWFMIPGHYFYAINEEVLLWEKASPMAKKIFFQAFVDANYESEKNSLRTFNGMQEKCQQGGVPRLAPIGHLNVADPQDPEPDLKLKKRIVVKDAERAPFIAKAFELYSTGKYSLTSLKEELDRAGLRARKTKKRPSRPVSRRGLEVILKNVFYTGMHKWNGILWPGKYEPLISTALYEQVQKVLREKALSENAGRRPSTDFPFRPFLRCGYCGCKITAGEGWRGHGYYWCTKMKDKECPQVNYRAEKIDELIAEGIGNVHLGEKTVAAIKQQLERASVDQEKGDKTELKRLKTLVTQEKNKLLTAYIDKAAGLISPEIYQRFSQEVQKNVASWEGETAKFGRVNPNFKSQGIAVMGLLKNLKQAYQGRDVQGKAKILEIVLEKVILENGKTRFVFKEPFNIFFDMARLIEKTGVQSKELWGE